MEGFRVWFWSLDLPRKDGDEAEESVKGQKGTFLRSFLNPRTRDSGWGFSLSVCERFSSDRSSRPLRGAGGSPWAIRDLWPVSASDLTGSSSSYLNNTPTFLKQVCCSLQKCSPKHRIWKLPMAIPNKSF